MKHIKGWRLPLAMPARTPDDAGSSQAHGRDIGRVIANALSNAGLVKGVRAGAPAAILDTEALGAYGTQVRRSRRPDANESPVTGQFLHGSFRNAAGSRNYKLYIPSRHAASTATVPLVVMLHGCTQSPDDFAAGTQMNRLADRDGFLVLYPEQSANANGSNCWNWFRAEDQQRDQGEPSLIAGLASRIVATHRVDPLRVFVAGLSAGAAMAVILGATYPDVFAAVGAHSGLPYASAHDVASAFAAMKGATKGMGGRPSPLAATPLPPVPTIVFHGDHDRTVDAGNGAAIAQQALDGHRHANPRTRACERASHGGRTCSRVVHADAADRPVVEHWVLHGAGHAWSGGDASGTFTDALGPCASAEMVRFFSAQRGSGRA